MGLFSGFFERRRQRESAVPDGDSFTPQSPAAEARPVGQPVQGVGSPLGAFGTGQPADFGGMLGMLGMIKDAYTSGNIQISHGGSHVIDLSGNTDTDQLREQLMAAMQAGGIDPQAAPDGTQVDASQYIGLQEDLLRVLRENGIDFEAPGSLPGQIDPDGDGKPG